MNEVLMLPLWVYLLLWISVSGLLLWYGFVRAHDERADIMLEEERLEYERSYQTIVLLLEELHQQLADLTARVNALSAQDDLDPDWIREIEGLDDL